MSLKSFIEAIGLQDNCANPDAIRDFTLPGSQVTNFPSIDVINKACPAIPKISQIQGTIDDSFRSFIGVYGEAIENLLVPFLKFLIFTEQLMLYTPWWITTLVLLGIVYALSRNIRFAIYVGIALIVIGILGMWSPAMQTLSFIFVCTLICVVLGIPIGIWMARNKRVQSAITPVLDVLQTMPSFVYLIPVVMLFGVGKVPGAIAVIFYAIPPVIRLTDLGIRLVDNEIIEAADAFGSSRNQKLMQVQIPLAMPTIMAGVNQTIMMSLAMVVIASMVGVRGIGINVLSAVTNQYLALGLFNGGAIVILAIIIDRVSRSAVVLTQSLHAENKG